MDVVCARRSRGIGFIIAALSAILASSASAQGTLPASWSMANIGSPALAGTATLNNGVVTVAGGGSGIGNTSDQFQFVYQAISGDTELVARVDNLNPADPNSKVGVMVRRSLAANSAFALAYVSGGRGLGIASRAANGGSRVQTVTASKAVAPVWLRIRRTGSSLTTARSADGNTWTTIGTVTVSLSKTAYVGLALASHSTSTKSMADLSQVTGVGSAEAPIALRSVDVGAPSPAGSTTLADDVYTMVGTGTGLWAFSDQFQFAYQAASGDIDIRARVDSFDNTLSTSRAAVMIRESLDPASPYAASVNRPTEEILFRRRLTLGGDTLSTSASIIGGNGKWVRLVRKGDRFDSYYSNDGTSWVLMGSEVVLMPADVLVGLAATNTSYPTPATATFSQLSIISSGAPSNQLPAVSLTVPTTVAPLTAPATIDLTANASDSDGSIAKVEFYAGSTLIGTDTAAPYTASWTSVPEGSHSLTAVAIDNAGGRTTSTPVVVTVEAANKPPTVSLTSPSVGQSFTAPAALSLAATASDPENQMARVEFWSNGVRLGSDSTAPYAFNWSSVPAGTYALTAIAFDQNDGQATSAAVTVSVEEPNQPPTVALTSPVTGQSAVAPAAFTLAANASDPEGRLARVEFHVNGALRATDTAAPFMADWSNVPAGTYHVHAIAFDAEGNRTVSGTATVVVAPAPTFMFAFTASADHATNVSGYRLDVFAAGANLTTTTPVATSDLAKPTPDAQSTITVDRTAFVLALPAGSYQATVTAIGPNGSTRSQEISFTR